VLDGGAIPACRQINLLPEANCYLNDCRSFSEGRLYRQFILATHGQ